MTGDDRGSDNLLSIAHFRPGYEWHASRFDLVVTGVPTRQLALLLFRILKLGSLVTLRSLGSLTTLGSQTTLSSPRTLTSSLTFDSSTTLGSPTKVAKPVTLGSSSLLSTFC